MPNDDDVQRALEAHSKRVDDEVHRFSRDLERVIAVAQVWMFARLLRSLKLNHEAQIAALAQNQRILRRLTVLWKEALDHAGLDETVIRYVATYPSQVKEFERILHAINRQAKSPLPIPTFTTLDKQFLQSMGISAGSDITATVEGAAQNVLSRTIYSTGGLSFHTLTETLVEKTGASVARAETLADTSLMATYRNAANMGFRKIEVANPDVVFRYLYMGPSDEKNRPFCRHILDINKAWTRAEINRMDSGAGPGTVMQLAGLWNCRHSWCLAPQPVASEPQAIAA